MSAATRKAKSGSGKVAGATASLKRKLDEPEPSGSAKRATSTSKKGTIPTKNIHPAPAVKPKQSRPKGKAARPLQEEPAATPPSDDEASLAGGTDVADAVRKGMRNSNVRLETNMSDSSIIGCRCSIYWPDDNEWYFGLILLVSVDGGKCFVFYDDGMTEWIDLAKNEMTIDAELGKVGNWAAMKVWISPKAEHREEFASIKTGI